jgi:hypothetical protein
MAALTSQSIVGGAAGTTPAVITAAASDTIAEGQFGPNGCLLRVITAGTINTVSVSDPGATASGNPGTVTPLTTPATGTRMIPIPRAAINPATGVATLTAAPVTALTYELYRV